ncbi:MAG TPA: SGNH/GDSL hydrolase family protein, partial [Vicinamibacteria bacterium]
MIERPPAPPPSGGWRRWVSNLLTALVAAGLCLPVLELGLRIVLPAPTAYRALPPNLTASFWLKNARGVAGPSSYRVNSMGARSREWDDNRRREYRVLCMGGSTTESLVNDQSRAWTTLLEQELGTLADGRRVWVGNIGRSGWSTRHHRLQARHLLGVYDPQVVVVLAGVNDLASRLKQGSDYDPRYLEKPERQATLVRQSFAVAPGRFASEWHDDPWLKRTRLWQLLRRLKYGVADQPDEFQDPEGRYLQRWRAARARGGRLAELPPLEGALDEYAENVLEIVRLARAHGARILLMTQPVLWREDLDEDEKASLWMGGVGEFRRSPRSSYYEPAALARAIDAYNERLLQVCARSGAECLDLAAGVAR